MFCTHCGASVPEGSNHCPQCGQQLGGQQLGGAGPAGQPDMGTVHQSHQASLGPATSYLAQSIIVTLVCCWPFGIPAIVFSAKTLSENSAGNYVAAHQSSKSAKMWGWISFGIGFLVVGGYILIIAAGVAATP